MFEMFFSLREKHESKKAKRVVPPIIVQFSRVAKGIKEVLVCVEPKLVQSVGFFLHRRLCI